MFKNSEKGKCPDTVDFVLVDISIIIQLLFLSIVRTALCFIFLF